MEDFWKNWSPDLISWLSTHGVRVLIFIVAAGVLSWILIRLVNKTISVVVTRNKQGSELAEQKREQTLKRIFAWCINVLLVVALIMVLLQELGVPVGPMLAGAGIVGLAVGFGGQYLIRDFITGIFLIMENQYAIGDVVGLDETEGVVEDISLRMTTLRDLNGTVHHVPHGDIKRVANMSKGFSRINVDITVSNDAHMEHVIEVINKVGHDLAADPAWKQFVIKAPQFLRIESFSNMGIVVKVLGDSVPLHQWALMGELRKRLKIAFDNEGIEIPMLASLADKPRQPRTNPEG